MFEYLLNMQGISKAFSGVQALDDVDLQIEPGQIVCLAGENGCGKSTLIKIISGAITLDSGAVEFEGKLINGVTPAEATQLGIQVIYQDLSIFQNLTVLENLSLNSEIANNHKIISWKRMKKTAQEALAKINHNIDLNATMGDLSVADKQLVAISRALLYNAKLIIMDEPTTALTKKEVEALFVTVRKLSDQHIAILFISHKLEEVFEISDKVVILRNGKNVHTSDTKDINKRQFTYYMTGRNLEDIRFNAQVLEEKPVLEVSHLTSQNKYNDISFSIKKGEILGVTGLLGSGRTELALSLFGLNPPDSGEIKMNGKPIILKSPIDAQKNRIGYVPEDRLTEGLFLFLPIRDNINVSKYTILANKAGILNKSILNEHAKHWVNKISILTDNPNKPVNTLSGGNQQRVVLAKWLANDLDVLVLNGPTVGVDIGSKQDIHKLLHQLAAEGLAIIIISDDIPEIVANCNRILVMRDGNLRSELSGDEIDSNHISEIIR